MGREMFSSKRYLKGLCRLFYFMGAGDFWMEDTYRSSLNKFLYYTWAVISNAYMISGTANEVLAIFRTDLTQKERKDVLLSFFAHPFLYSKVVVVYLERDRIKEVFRSIFKENKAKYFPKEIDKAAVKKAMLYCAFYSINVISTLFISTIDSIKIYYKTGAPIQTETTLFPTPHHTGILVNVLRFFITFHWSFIVVLMCINDAICFTTLIILESRFKLLQAYFLSLREKFVKDGKSRKEKERQYFEDFRTGMLMLEDTLWCVRHFQSTLGIVNSIQILQSISLLVILFIQLVSGERNLTFMASIMMFIISVITLTGVYMTVSGDITFEAAKLPTCIFHSGWELSRARPQLRCLVVAAVLRSQTPVYLTAFHIVNLSYSTFISVLRFSYSFFAVMY